MQNRSIQMSFLLKPIRIAAALGCVSIIAGCAAKENDRIHTSTCQRQTSEPDFVIWLVLESDGSLDRDILLTECQGPAIFATMGDSNTKEVRKTSQYMKLRREILESETWKQMAVKKTLSGGSFYGAPRDILVVRHLGKEMTLQGAQVPTSWKKSIVKLSHEAVAR